jgi:hypothetical protein
MLENADRFPRFPRVFLKVKRGYFRGRLLHDTRVSLSLSLSLSLRSRIAHKCHPRVVGKLRRGGRGAER